MTMTKDAFDRWWEWVEKPPDSALTIPVHFHDAVMQLPPEQRRDRRTVNEAIRLTDPDAQKKSGPFEPLFFCFYGQGCRRPS
jgi:hypothetical protein